MEIREVNPATTSSLVIDNEIINTNINKTNGTKYPMTNASGPSDFSNATFTVSPLLNLPPELMTSITLLSTSETEQVPFV